MAKQAKRRRARAAEEPRAERTNAGREPDRRQDLAMIVWLLAPERIETLRRRLIDGTAGAIEPFLYTRAYDGPLDSEPSLIWVASEPLAAAEAGHTPADPPKAEGRETNPAGGGKTESESGNGIRWDKRAMDVRRAARALVEDPEYQESLRRRLDDGKAPQMMRLLLQWPAMKSHDPRELWRGKPPLAYGSKYLPWDPRADPLRERAQRMIEAKAREEEARARQAGDARAQQAAREKPAALPPADASDPDELELVDPADYDLPRYRDT